MSAVKLALCPTCAAKPVLLWMIFSRSVPIPGPQKCRGIIRTFWRKTYLKAVWAHQGSSESTADLDFCSMRRIWARIYRDQKMARTTQLRAWNWAVSTCYMTRPASEESRRPAPCRTGSAPLSGISRINPHTLGLKSSVKLHDTTSVSIPLPY